MMGIDDDGDLPELFARLREEDRARAPSFQATIAAGARRRRLPPKWVVRAVAAAAAVVVITFAYEYRQTAARRERARAELRHRVIARSGWATPTDFLLNTPGTPLLRTLPSFGSGRWTRPSSTNLRTRNPS
jgi:hypothetical protein